MLKYLLLALIFTTKIALADAPVVWSGTTAQWLPGGLQSPGIARLDAQGVMTSFADGIEGQVLTKRSTPSAKIQWEFPTISLGIGNVGSSPNAAGASYSSNTLTLQPASATLPGVVTAGAQSLGGVKSFPDEIKVDYIKNLAGATTILLPNWILRDNNGYNSVAWNDNTLTDSNNILSANWLSRLLKNTSGATVLNWETGALTGSLTGNVTGDVSGNAGTATALASNPSDCAANTYATTIAANGNLTCSTVSDTGLATSYIKADGSRGLSANWNAGAFDITATTFIGALTGNSSTASALAANPSDCSSNNYATAIAANGNLTCGQVNAAAGLTGATPIANGGTGQATQTDGFDALAPTTTDGDMIAFNGTDNIRIAGGLNGQALMYKTTGSPKIQWATLPSSGGSSYTPPTSRLRYDSVAGYCSSSCDKIRYFTTLTTNSGGADLSSTSNDSTNGLRVTVNTSGTYCISYTDQFSGSSEAGLTINSSQLTTGIGSGSITGTSVLASQRSVGANQDVSVAWCGYIAATSIIRPHTSGSSTGTDAGHGHFDIVRIN